MLVMVSLLQNAAGTAPSTARRKARRSGGAHRRRKPEGNPRTEAGAGSPKGNTGREAAGCGPKLPSQEGLKQETEMVLAGLEETDSTDQPSAHRRCQRALPRRVRRAPGWNGSTGPKAS